MPVHPDIRLRNAGNQIRGPHGLHQVTAGGRLDATVSNAVEGMIVRRIPATGAFRFGTDVHCTPYVLTLSLQAYDPEHVANGAATPGGYGNPATEDGAVVDTAGALSGAVTFLPCIGGAEMYSTAVSWNNATRPDYDVPLYGAATGLLTTGAAPAIFATQTIVGLVSGGTAASALHASLMGTSGLGVAFYTNGRLRN